MCERCNRRTESTKRLTIQRFPQVIVMRILSNANLATLPHLPTSLAVMVDVEDLNSSVLDLNRFAMSRYMVCRSTVCVSFPLTSLDLGPYGPVDCGNLSLSLCLSLSVSPSLSLPLCLSYKTLGTFCPQNSPNSVGHERYKVSKAFHRNAGPC